MQAAMASMITLILPITLFAMIFLLRDVQANAESEEDPRTNIINAMLRPLLESPKEHGGSFTGFLCPKGQKKASGNLYCIPTPSKNLDDFDG